MKKIVKFYILITAFSFILPSNAMAQNQKKQIVKDNIKSTSKNENIADKIINNYDENSAEINGKFYIGIDASYQNSKLGGAKNPYDYYEPQTSAVAVFAGYDNQDFYKIEGFYMKTNEKKQVTAINSLANYELITKTAGIDFKPYLIFDKDTPKINVPSLKQLELHNITKDYIQKGIFNKYIKDSSYVCNYNNEITFFELFINSNINKLHISYDNNINKLFATINNIDGIENLIELEELYLINNIVTDINILLKNNKLKTVHYNNDQLKLPENKHFEMCYI
jgi:hypothetical protein